MLSLTHAKRQDPFVLSTITDFYQMLSVLFPLKLMAIYIAHSLLLNRSGVLYYPVKGQCPDRALEGKTWLASASQHESRITADLRKTQARVQASRTGWTQILSYSTGTPRTLVSWSYSNATEQTSLNK